jgi:acyl-CoA thioester hydrolase
MGKLQIDLPKKFIFSTKLNVRMGDLAGGFHLGNHMLVSYLNESMMVLLRENGFPNLLIEGYAFINSDLAVIYKSESFHGDTLNIDIAIVDFHKNGCDLIFKVTNEKTGMETAIAKMSMLFYDHGNKTIGNVPEKFKTVFHQE